MSLERRRLLILGGAALLSSACKDGSVIFTRQQDSKPEKPNRIPQVGSIVTDGYNPYLLSVNNTKYPIPDIKRYLVNSKRENEKILSGTAEVRDALIKYKTGVVPREKIIIIQGDVKINKPFGGELICIGGGFMTEDGIPKDGTVGFANSFVQFKKRLEKNGFTNLDEFFFPWGRKDLEIYSSLDTAKNPEESVDNMIEYIEYLVSEFPLCQQNWTVHSLAGTILVQTLIKRPDLLSFINNITFLSSPIRGIDAAHKNLLDIAISQSEIVRLYLGNEKVTSYLAKIWNDQKPVDELGKRLIDLNKGVIIAWAKNDPILSEDAIRIEGVTPLSISSQSFDIFKPLTYLDPHGATIRDSSIIEANAQKIGQNRAAV